MPVISTTAILGAKPVARAAALRPCATGTAGISPTEPQRSQIKNSHHRAASWSCAQARKALRAFDAMDEAVFHQESSARYTVIGAGRGIDLASSSITSYAPSAGGWTTAPPAPGGGSG